MIIREYQLAELSRARKLQSKLAELHIPSPVMSWAYEVKDASGEVTEKGIGKANSFTRNALNIMACNVGMSAYNILSSTWGDGNTNTKNTVGTVTPTAYYRYANNSENAAVFIGTDTTAENLDSYELPAYSCSTTVTSGFNAATRILTTAFVGTYVNTTGGALSITESAIRMKIGSSTYALMARDVFTAITLENGATMTWTYSIEVSYPNP